jgi:hypothetical protein
MQTKRLTPIPGMALTAMLMLLVVLVCGQDARAAEDIIIGTWNLKAVQVDCDTGVVTQPPDSAVLPIPWLLGEAIE